MKYYLFNFFGRAFSSFIDLVFIIFSSYLLCLFITFLCVKRRGKKYTNFRLYTVYFVLGLSGAFLQTAVFLSLNTNVYIILFYLFFYVSICFFLFAIISFVNKKEEKEVEDELLNKLIDEEIEKEDFTLEKTLTTRIKAEKEKPMQKDEEVDFSHVKNVMERLSFYDLSVYDKKQLRELKETVYIAESEGISDFLREKINDGLSNLLKIMSKHGV